MINKLRDKNTKCEECHGTAKHHRNWAIIHGHILCGYCKRRTSFPNILGKHNDTIGTITTEKTYNSPTSIQSAEGKILFGKHIRETGNEREAQEAVHRVRYWAKAAHSRFRVIDRDAKFIYLWEKKK